MFVGGKVCQRTQPLSCSRHKRNGCKAQAALPTMMSGLDGCLRADVTWAGSGEKEGESFHVCFSAAQCWLGTVAEQGLAWSASISPIMGIDDCHQHNAEFLFINKEGRARLQWRSYCYMLSIQRTDAVWEVPAGFEIMCHLLPFFF